MNKDEIKMLIDGCIDPCTDKEFCNKCEYYGYNCCQDYLCRDALAIINEQEKEIEKQNSRVKVLKERLNRKYAHISNAETEYEKAFELLKAQEREIERLKDKCEELRNEKWNAQDDLDCYCDEMPNKIKRAKIDMLNKLRKKKSITIRDIDEIIEELQK